MALDLRAMLTGDANRLRFITRYSTNMQLHRENVAEHTFYVALYGMFLANWANEKYPFLMLDELEVLKRCLVHDLDEALTGDFQRPFKYRSADLRSKIEEISREIMVELAEQIAGEPCRVSDCLVNRWINSKDDTEEGSVVAFADFLSVLSHMSLNQIILKDYAAMTDYAMLFRESRFDFLRPLILEAEDLLGEITGERLPCAQS